MRFSRDHRPIAGNCFVVMPYGVKKLPNGNDFDWDVHYRDVLAVAISEAGMTPVRADDIYGAQPLIERVWRGIQEAEVVVADLTGRSPNVLYELGLAHVIGKRLILLTMDAEDVPADLAHFVQIRYSDGRGLLHLHRELIKNLAAARSEPAAEVVLSPMPDGRIERVPVTVVTVTSELAVIQANDGRKGFLYTDDVSWTRRYPDLTKVPQLQAGESLNGAFVVDVKGELKYSLIAAEENPWPKLESKFQIGIPFAGKIVNRIAAGAFVRMEGDINGFIPQSQIPTNLSLDRGAEVRVTPFRIDSSRREVELRFVGVVEQEKWGPYSTGQQFDGTVSRISSVKDFVLVTLPDGFRAILHMANMSDDFRQRLEKGEIRSGSAINVEIMRVDNEQRKLQLRDIKPT